MVRYIIGRPLQPDEVWQRLLSSLGHWAAFGYGNWSVRLDGQQIGTAGIFDARRNIDPPFDGLETGWVFDPAFHGHGYAREALEAVLHAADTQLKQRSTLCMISPDNEPSLKLALRSGYMPAYETTYLDSPVVILRRPAAA